MTSLFKLPVVVITSRGCLQLAEEDRALLDPDQVERQVEGVRRGPFGVAQVFFTN